MDKASNNPNKNQFKDTNNTTFKEPDDNTLSDVIDTAFNTSLNEFPIKIFPEKIQSLVLNANETVLYNKDYLCAGILSVCAAAMGNSMRIDNGSYISKPILWITIIGRPGTGKTHPLQFAKAPLEKLDMDSFTDYEQNINDSEQYNKTGKWTRPIFPKYVLKDFTPEKLIEAMQHNKKGVLIFQDELMRWINSFDQYKKGGDQQMYLDLFNGNSLTSDRVTKEPIMIEETNVNILGGMQPDLLKGLAQNHRSKDGFLDRFLFVIPDNLKPSLYTGKKIEAQLLINYENLIIKLTNAPSQTVFANEETINIYKLWQHKKAVESFNDHLETAIQAKMETYVWRFALIIEIMHQTVNEEQFNCLSVKSMNDAIVLVEYFRNNTLKAHDRIISKNPLESLTPIQLELYENLPYEFKRIDVLALFREKGMPIRTSDRFLNNTLLFHNYKSHKDLKLGQYKKKII